MRGSTGVDRGPSSSVHDAPDLNLVVLQGALSSPPRTLELPSGAVLVRLEVTTRSSGAAAESAPVACFDPPASVASLRAGDEVLVVGRVRRRWYGGAGGSSSSTEVVATTVLRAGRRAAVRRALQGCVAALEPSEGTSM
jgi:single-strand DNA-binding protein